MFLLRNEWYIFFLAMQITIDGEQQRINCHVNCAKMT